MTWLRILTAAGLLLVAASAVLVLALFTSAAGGDRDARPESDTETRAHESGLIPRPEDGPP